MKNLFLLLLSLTLLGCAKEELQEKESPYQSISTADMSVMASADLSKGQEPTYFHSGEVINVHFKNVVDQHLHLEVLETITSETGIEFNVVTKRLKHVTAKINYNEDPALETVDYVVTNNAEIDVVFSPWTNSTFLGHEHRPTFNDYIYVKEGNSIELIARLYAYKLGQESASTEPIDFDFLRSIY